MNQTHQKHVAVDTTRYTFDSRNFTQSGNHHVKAWNAAMEIIAALVIEVGEDRGPYRVCVYRQVRWKGNHTANPVKLSLYEHGLVYLTVKTPINGNESVFEYSIRGEFSGWNPSRLFHKLRDAIVLANAALPAEEPPVTTVKTVPPAVVTTPAAKLTVVERIAKLEATAHRNAGREADLQALRQTKERRLAEMQAIKVSIDDLETTELKLMEEIDKDEECREAQRAMATLESLLS